MSYWLNDLCYSPDGSFIEFHTPHGFMECSHQTCPLDKLSPFGGTHCFQCCYGNVTASALQGIQGTRVSHTVEIITYADVMMYLGPIAILIALLLALILVWQTRKNKADATVCPQNDSAGVLSTFEMQLEANSDIPIPTESRFMHDVGYQNDTNDETDDPDNL